MAISENQFACASRKDVVGRLARHSLVAQVLCDSNLHVWREAPKYWIVR